MDQIRDFLLSEHVLAFLIAFLIVLITVFLAAKQWIGFSLALLFLIFSLAAGLIINNQHSIQHYFTSYAESSAPGNESQDAFRKQILQAVEDLKLEVNTEKQNLQRVMNQVQEIVDSIDIQKQKLQQFIEETKERFKTDYAPKTSTNRPASQVDDLTGSQEHFME